MVSGKYTKGSSLWIIDFKIIAVTGLFDTIMYATVSLNNIIQILQDRNIGK